MPRDLRDSKLQDEFFQMLEGKLDDPSAKLFSDLFGGHKSGPPKFYVDDIINIGPEQSPFVNPKSATTCGKYLFNKFVIEPLGVFGYINKNIDVNAWENLEEKIGDARFAKDITIEQVWQFIDRSQYLLGGPLSQIINPSLNGTVMMVPPSAKKLKEELLKKYEKELANNDPQVAAMIETKIVDEVLKVMRETGDPTLALFDSGAIDPYNNYKTMFIMKGAIIDNTGESLTGYKFVGSNYNDGITKEDLPKISDSLVTSAYAKGVSTQLSGYNAKKYNSAFQQVALGPKGSDCKTTKYLTTIVTKNHMYRYIKDGAKLVEITPENIDKYKGKTYQMRDPLYCKYPDPKYCNICSGERSYGVGAHNVGMMMNTISGAMLNAGMKAFHDVRVKTYKVTVDDLLKYVE